MSTALQIDVAGDLPALFELSKHLVESGFLPEHIRKPGQAVAIILAGRELGMPPMRALRALTMVKGKVVESADSQLARFKSEGGKATFTTLTEEAAELHLTHPNGDEHTEKFTMADAKRAGLTANATWSKYPKAMLRSRTITAGLKSVGWDGAVGNYDPDEAREIAPPQPVIQMPRRLSDASAASTSDLVHGNSVPAGVVVREGTSSVVAEEVDDTLALLERSVAEVNAKAAAQCITQKQLVDMMVLAREEGKFTEKQVKEWLKSQGFASRKDITQDKYDAICERLADPTPLGA